MKNILALVLLVFGIVGCNGVYDFKLFSKCKMYGEITFSNENYQFMNVYKKRIGNELFILPSNHSAGETGSVYKRFNKTTIREFYVLEISGTRFGTIELLDFIDTHILEWNTSSGNMKRYNCRKV